MFREARCDYCGECLKSCQYLSFAAETEGEEIRRLAAGEEREWIYSCITCMACNEYCPNGARPFDLILRRQEEGGRYADPKTVDALVNLFSARSEPRPVEAASRAMSLCVMSSSMPWALEGQLFSGMTLLKGLPYFCNVLFAHLANEALIKSRLARLVDNLAQSGAGEIIFLHEDCYALFHGMAPEYGVSLPFRPIHFFEYLRDYLKEHENELVKLNIKAAYQRPCASRYTPPEVESVLDEIFALTGVKRVERKYDRREALCCGVEEIGVNIAPMKRGGRDLTPYREKNISDAVDSGAEAMVYFCAMCFRTLSSQANSAGLLNYMLSDLCRLSLGENLSENRPL
jgi:Fe-S oxidoreductase